MQCDRSQRAMTILADDPMLDRHTAAVQYHTERIGIVARADRLDLDDTLSSTTIVVWNHQGATLTEA